MNHLTINNMGNTDNKCKDLDLREEQFEKFERVFRKQEDIQTNVYNNQFKALTLANLAKFWFANKHAMEDELSEMFDALGGIHDGVGNSAWKDWKKDHSIAERSDINYLSESDKKELLFEMADVLIFFMNFPISVGFTGSELMNAVESKINENHDRQRKGY